jgi:hypothetical protein
MAMPSVPNTNAGSGVSPGEARTIPTIAVNTINKLTLGFVSERYSRHPGWDSAVISESCGDRHGQRVIGFGCNATVASASADPWASCCGSDEP